MTHVEGDVNPVRDIEIINEELRLKDEEFLMATLKKTEQSLRGDKSIKAEFVSLINNYQKMAALILVFFLSLGYLN